MTEIFIFQHNAVIFFKYRSDFWSRENAIKYCPFLLTSDESRTGTGKALAAPAHKSIFAAAQKEGQGMKDKKSSVSNDNFPSSPLFFQVLFIKSEWTTPDGWVLLPEQLQQTKYYLLFSSSLPRSLCSSPIPSTDLKPPPAPLQTPSTGSVFIIVFIIAPHSFSVASQLHSKGTKKKPQWKGQQWLLSSRSPRAQVRGGNSSGLPWKLVV